MRQQKGFTLVELLVTLGLAGIIISLVMSFFIANFKSYKTINTESELQYQSQYIINYMTNKILEANKVISVNGDIDASGPITDISDISFKHGTDTLKFEVDINKKIIFVDKDPSNRIELGSNAKLNVTPIPNDKLFAEAYGLEIELVLNDGGQKYTAKQTVYMRNHK